MFIYKIKLGQWLNRYDNLQFYFEISPGISFLLIFRLVLFIYGFHLLIIIHFRRILINDIIRNINHGVIILTIIIT